ncbi:MAG TPA: M14 family zinc carboxypeptidase, partial [bacterium]
MKDHALHSLRTFLLSLLALVSGYILMAGLGTRNGEGLLDVRIFTPSPRDTLRLKKFDFKIKSRNGGKYIDATVSEAELARMKNSGFEVAFLSNPPRRNFSVPASYKTHLEIEDDIAQLKAKYPGLVSVEKIGESTTLRLPIWAIKISDNSRIREDEPRVFFAGVHHAREPIGANICFKIIDSLCEKYGYDEQITKWVDNIEIWFVPVVNPDGYKYVMENNLSFPWWRKNLRDNDGDGVFNPLVDGVDLNRNYDYNWGDGGDGKPGSWFYRGRMPFSENETRAVMDLATRENFVFGVSYHSYGESILFPWGNYKRPPDIDLIVTIASEMAANIRRQSGRGRYSILPLNGRVGQSSIWMYGHLRVIDFIIEVGNEYFPAEESVPFIVQENQNGAFYLLDRVLETGIRGHVLDAQTRKPLSAEIEILEYASDYVQPRKTDPDFGGFYRVVNPGSYTLEIRS